MKLRLLTTILLVCLTGLAFANGTYATRGTNGQPTVIVVVGAAGEAEFGVEFAKWTEQWRKATEQAGAIHQVVGIGPTNAITDLAQLKEILSNEPTNTTAELWLVLIGHGTFDGKEAKFNLRGPDLSATELAEWLKSFRRPVIVINSASSSSPFLNKLSGPERIIVTATKSGYEESFARFGKFIAEAMTDLKADLDKDGQTSLLEAFIMASRQVAEFYATEGRLATETALLDDNGDGLGTPADFFRGARAVKEPAGGGTVDGLRAHQIHLIRSEQEQQMPAEIRARRDELELAVARLRESKATFAADEYYRRLENLMLELAKIYSAMPQDSTSRVQR
ncbi:MAG: hypothetical protein IH623_29865 [Verrucomicrobia bacterium]|nr:hypothetical protein [Verrucomicrobiota bacterium]